LLLAERILSADRDYMAGEAALKVADAAVPPDAVLGREGVPEVLEALGLLSAVYRWDGARVALITLTRCRLGVLFSADTLHGHVPPRAWKLIPGVITTLLAQGLIVRAGHTARSAVAHRKAPLYRLTLAGEWLSRQVAPIPGMTPHLENLQGGR
jgi:hypothetical protein